MNKRFFILSLSLIVWSGFTGCAKDGLPSMNDPKYAVSQPVDENKDGIIDGKDIQLLETKANDRFNTLIIPVYKKAGIEIETEQDINKKESEEKLEEILTVAEWKKLKASIDEWNKIKAQIKATKKWLDENPAIADSGIVGDFIANNECSIYFWLKDGRQAQLIGVGIPNNTSGYMLMSRDMFYKLALGKQAKIEYDTVKATKIGGTDQVLLIYLYVGKRFINAEMIRTGYARAKPMSPNNRYDKKFMELEKEAKKKKIGIWKFTDEF